MICRTVICKRAAIPDSPWCGACLQVRLSDAFGPPLATLRDHYETLPAEVQTPRRDDDGSPPPPGGAPPTRPRPPRRSEAPPPPLGLLGGPPEPVCRVGAAHTYAASEG